MQARTVPIRPCLFFLCLLVVLVGLPSCFRPAKAPDALDLVLQTEDGWAMPATYHPAADATAPTVVLLHALGRDREVWSPYVHRFQQAGYGLLRLDLRGHGGARLAEKAKPYKTFGTADWKSILYDIRAARDYLVEERGPEVSIVLAGEDLGATLALHYAVKDEEIRAVVMVSPTLESQHLSNTKAIAALGEVPILLLAGEQDPLSASAALTLQDKAPQFAELRSYASSMHGVDLYADKPDALEQTLVWLNTVLPEKSGVSSP